MSIVFLIPTPPPVVPAAEAYAQEIKALIGRFGGRVVYLNPNRFLPRHFPWQLPRLFFGWHCLPNLRLAARHHRLYQIYSPTLYAYPVLSQLRRPIVYNLTGTAGEERVDATFFNRLAAVTVPDSASFERLREAGLVNVQRVRAGIETDRFHCQPMPVAEEIHLLMASAPWTSEQFSSKGFDALLAAAVQEPRLRLTFLWRGVLTREARRRVEAQRLGDRVRILDEVVDVDQALAGTHATVNLATDGNIVKAYPHSLMESLAAGKPVLISRAIPMAEYVEAKGVGEVIEEVTAESFLLALQRLLVDYSSTQQRAAEHGRQDFSLTAMLESFEAVYRQIPTWARAQSAA